METNSRRTTFSTHAPKALPPQWVEGIFLKLQAIYLKKWTDNFPNEVILKESKAMWGEALHDLSGDDIKYAISEIATKLQWPPSIAEFRAIAKARVGSYRDASEVAPQLDAPREYVPASPLLQEYMAKHPESHSAEGIADSKQWLNAIRGRLDVAMTKRKPESGYTKNMPENGVNLL